MWSFDLAFEEPVLDHHKIALGAKWCIFCLDYIEDPV